MSKLLALYTSDPFLAACEAQRARAMVTLDADAGSAGMGGYDDGIVAALAVCDMLDRAPDKTIADLRRALPKTYQSPTMSPHCDDEKKYGVVDRVVADYEKIAKDGGSVAGQKIRDLVTVNGVRVTLEDGTWGLVRASSNKPELVIVVESPASEERKIAMFRDIEHRLAQFPEVGEYNQKI